MLVLIPIAGIESRLDFNISFMNKAMVQMGDPPVLFRITDSNPTHQILSL